MNDTNVLNNDIPLSRIGYPPSDWLSFRLGSIGDTYGGLTGKTKENFGKGNAYYIPYVNVNKNYIVKTDQIERVEIDTSEKQNKVNYGDILFTTSSETPEEVGMTSVVLSYTENLYLNSFCFGFRPDISKINPHFAAYFFRGPSFRKDIFKLAQGSTRYNISKLSLMGIKITIPKSIEEQQKIAEILSTVDEQIENTKQLIKKTKELKKGLMQQLLTKGIGHTEFKVTELGEIPVSWEIVKLSDISGFITKGSTPTTYGYEWQNTGIPFFKSDVVKEGEFVFGDYKFISEEAHLQMSRSVIRSGDILISITGNIGRVAIVPQQIKEGNINQHIAKITIESSLSNPLFVYHWLNQEKIESYYKSIKTGLAYPQISLKQVRETIIPLPSIEEQQRIAEILTAVDEQIYAYKQEIEKYTELKKGLMQQLLTGKVRVTV